MLVRISHYEEIFQTRTELAGESVTVHPLSIHLHYYNIKYIINHHAFVKLTSYKQYKLNNELHTHAHFINDTSKVQVANRDRGGKNK
jgi:hypothetical protein